MAHGNFFAAAPTRDQAKRIYWKDLKAMTRPFWARRASESELMIELITGSMIAVIGMDKPDRIEGSPWHGGILDEYASMKPGVWSENVMPVFLDTHGWCDLIGVPEGRNHYYDLYRYARRGENSDWGAFTWKSIDVIPPEDLLTFQESYDPRTYRQEFEATFETNGGIVYYTFNPQQNLCDMEFDPKAPIWLCWDFNSTIKPMSVIVVQEIKGELFVTKEFVFRNTRTNEMCTHIEEFLEQQKFKESGAALKIVGDYAGNQSHSSASRSDYQIINSYFKNYPNYEEVYRVCHSIKDRTASLCALLCSQSGKIRLKINRNCLALIKDFERVEWAENGQKLDDTIPELTHPSDALSYFSYNLYPIDYQQFIVSS